MIAEARNRAGLTQGELAEKVPCDRATISRIETGNRQPSARMRHKIARALDLDPDYFIGNAKSPPTNDAIAKELQRINAKLNMVTIPIIGTVPAGHPETKEQHIIGEVCLSVDKVGGMKKDLFALEVSGESLQGDGIHSGDVVIFDPHFVFEDGKIYALRLNNNEVTLKHVYKSDGTVNLVSSNQEFKSMKVKEVEILGRLIWLQRSY